MIASRLPDVLRMRLRRPEVARLCIGDAAIDARLGGGIAAAALHDLYAAQDQDASATVAFALGLALSGDAGRPIAWIRAPRSARRSGVIAAEGLVELGADPAMLLLVMPDDDAGVLRAADDVTRHGGAGGVIVELYGRAPGYDLTASRRLAMAAARTGVLVLMVRIDGTAVASAAETRWQVAAAPSVALAAGAPGHPAFDITLLRHRGGIAGFDARLEWNRDERRFKAVSGAVPAAVAGGAGSDRRAA